MPEVKVPLVLEDRASSSVDKFCQKLEKTEDAWEKMLSTAREYEKEEKAIAAENRMLEKMSSLSDEMLKARGFTQQMVDELREWQAEQERLATQDAISGKVQAMMEARDATEEMTDSTERAGASEEKMEAKTSRLASALKGLASGAKKAVLGLLGFGKASTPLDGVVNRLKRMALSLFTVRRLLRYMKDAMEVAPAEIADSFTALGTTIKKNFNTVFATLLRGLQPGIDKLRASLESPGGQRFLKGLAKMAEVAGQAIGWLAEKVGQLVEWIGNNWNVVMPVAIGLLSLFAAKMLIAAAATLAAHWPLLLIIGAVVGVITLLAQLGVTAADVFGFIGGCISVACAWFENLWIVCENITNAINAAWAALCNNLWVALQQAVNAIHSVLAQLVSDFVSAINSILNVISHLPGAGPGGAIIDAFEANGVDFYGAMDASASYMSGKASEYANKAYELNGSMQDIGAAWQKGWNAQGKEAFQEGWNDEAWARGEEAGRSFGKTIDDFLNGFSADSLENYELPAIKADIEDANGSLGGIGGSVANIEKAVAMSEEELKQLVDLAERKYVNNVNLTSQAPVIQVSGANTGNTPEDRKALADAIATVLMEQISSGTVVSTVMA